MFSCEIPFKGTYLSSSDGVSTTSLTRPGDNAESSTGHCHEYGCHGNNCTSKSRSQLTTSIDVSRRTASAADEDDSRLVEDRVTDADPEDRSAVQDIDVTAQYNGVECANYSNSDNDDTNSTSRRSSSILDGGIAVDQADTVEVRMDSPVVDEDSPVHPATIGCSSRQREPRTTISGPQLNALLSAFSDTPKPSRQAREQLAAQTGLSMRVIQVSYIIIIIIIIRIIITNDYSVRIARGTAWALYK